ncbi:EAL domain-containing protein [Oscillatoria sp. CS-180]|uniref:EAL domain-containing protein n=1 Tax=Oscillatoria sp. CS-180 TaxID=3021720 RepID=UPI00232E65F4|nr:EAL domain-containing protein [Oscillatoria sp. CS-180]MDB9524708.1 EAL domain-containing protein [Oscillatoria sp. CS-180]
MISRFFKDQWRFLPGALASLITLILNQTGALADLENASYRWLFRVRGEKAWDDRIVLLTIDDATLTELGQFPLPRGTYARLLERMAVSPPAGIGFNIFFVEPSAEDAAFAREIAEAGNVVLSSGVDEDSHLLTSTQSLQSAAIATGHVLKQVESDGLVHTVRLQAADEPAFAVVLAEVFSLTHTLVELPSLDRPLWVNWPGSAENLPHYSFSDVLLGRISPSLLEDKLVLVGMTATGVDALPTPYDDNPPASGIVLQAAVLDNLLQQRSLRPIAGPWLWILTLIAMPGVSYCFVRRPLLWQLLFFLGAWLGWLVFSVLLFQQNYLLPRSLPLVSLGLTGVTTIVGQQIRESVALDRLLESLWQHYRYSTTHLSIEPTMTSLISKDLGDEVRKLALMANMLSRAQATQSAIAQTIPIAMLTVDSDDRVCFCNSLAEQYLNIKLGQTLTPAIVPEWLETDTWQRITKTLSQGQTVAAVERKRDSKWFEMRFEIFKGATQPSPLLQDNGQFILILVEDITHRKATELKLRLLNQYLEEEVRQRTQELEVANFSLLQETAERRQVQKKLTDQAFRDELTGLPNRTYLKTKLSEMMANPQASFAVLFIGCDRFKLINDSFGHIVGDELLRAISQRLSRCIKAADLIARFSGDEFTILLTEIKDAQSAVRVSQRIHRQFHHPFRIADQEFYSSCSIGIVLSNSDYQQATDILRDADIAMYCAKRNGAGYTLFKPEMHLAIRSSLQLETDLHQSLSRGELVVYYQPIFNIKTKQIAGFEALVRWQHPIAGLIRPDEFIPLAEETGLIIKIGQWVLKEACSQMYQWQQQLQLPADVFMSVNLSVQQFNEPNLLKRIDAVLQETRLESQYLKLEITESAILADSDLAVQTFQSLKERGISLGIDDFGTGYSSLTYLHRFPVDVLKIDRSFIQRMAEGQKHLSLVQSIKTLADHFDMDMIAEGIETEVQIESLKLMGCVLGQGYFFSPPVDGETIATKYSRCQFH